jgi:hypothetical protein
MSPTASTSVAPSLESAPTFVFEAGRVDIFLHE